MQETTEHFCIINITPNRCLFICLCLFREKNIGLIVGVVLGIVALITIAIIVVVCAYKQRSKLEENKLRLTARMSGLDESEVCIKT